MADLITTGTSDYISGSIDSATVLVSNVSPISAKHPNGLAAGLVQVETILGSGTSLKGSKADLVARLAVALNSDGTIKVGSTSAFTGQLTVPNGGTGQSTAPDQRYLIGNGTTFDLLTPHGFIYSGPTQTATGSTAPFNGVVTIGSNQALDGLNIYSTFVLNAGVTLTLGANTDRLIIYSSTSITINGTINAAGKGSSAGGVGFTQPGGGGGGGTGGATPTAGGSVQIHGVTRTNGGAAGVNGVSGTAGSAGTLQTGSGLSIADPFSILGGAGGGQGGNSSGGAGGAGGGSIILIAPIVILGVSCILNTSGINGVAGGNQSGGGGGGGAGNLYIFSRVFQDNSGGTYFTSNAGSGGAAGASGGAAGGAGRAGVKQIFTYANS